MADKELKHMSRGELLEMLIAQVEENEKQQQELEEARAALDDRQLTIENAGSIAEAALQVNGVFEAAQAAAQQYLDNLQRLDEQQELIAQRLQQEARAKADLIVAEANAYSRLTHEKADAYSQRVRAEADAYSQRTRAEADVYWHQVSDKVRNLLQEQETLRTLLQSGRNTTE